MPDHSLCIVGVCKYALTFPHHFPKTICICIELSHSSEFPPSTAHATDLRWSTSAIAGLSMEGDGDKITKINRPAGKRACEGK
jgi:hypothetical protein